MTYRIKPKNQKQWHYIIKPILYHKVVREYPKKPENFGS